MRHWFINISSLQRLIWRQNNRRRASVLLENRLFSWRTHFSHGTKAWLHRNAGRTARLMRLFRPKLGHDYETNHQRDPPVPIFKRRVGSRFKHHRFPSSSVVLLLSQLFSCETLLAWKRKQHRNHQKELDSTCFQLLTHNICTSHTVSDTDTQTLLFKFSIS